ncbi:MAG: hypothetical protein EBX52_10735 [Proteobacteria bacterium]|nr:hypothetical protein [Pseudomonadota bacterium]
MTSSTGSTGVLKPSTNFLNSMLRRAMGKKKADEMAKHKEIFVAGATKRGVDQKKAGELFDLMAKFAEYGFNKSHSAAYGVITYQTAYLKTYFPVEFMAALMTTEMSDTDKLAKYTADARAMGITVLPPDVNRSVAQFMAEPLPNPVNGFQKAIRFGLEAIKGVGGTAVEAILEARVAGFFETPIDFAKRTGMRKVNKKVLESLILSGGFDSICEKTGLNRASLFSSIENLIQYGQDEQAKAELGQSSLFDDFKAEEVKLSTPLDSLIKKEPEWPLAKRLLSEKQVLGFYISGHPMQNWQEVCKDWLGTTTESLRELAAKAPPAPAQAPSYGPNAQKVRRKEVKLAGIVAEFKEIMTKKGSKMAFLQIEDLLGRVEVIAFPEFYANHQALIQAAKDSPEPILITGEFEVKEGEPKILANALTKLEDAHGSRTVTVVIEIDPDRTGVEQLRSFKQHVLKNRGRSPVNLVFQAPDWSGRIELPKELRVDGTPQFAAEVNRIFGHPVARLQ